MSVKPLCADRRAVVLQPRLFSGMPDGVHEIEHAEAKAFIERWHYSQRMPTGKNLLFGWFVGGELYAVADYGIGVNPYQAAFLQTKTGMPVCDDSLLELKRLCRTEPRRDDCPLTAFLSACHVLLSGRGFRFVVSFSDPNHGHRGGIYRAANFVHMGVTNPEFHCADERGNIRHRRFAFRYARRNDVTVGAARIRLCLTRVQTLPKDRWFYVIDPRLRRKFLKDRGVTP